LYILSPPATPIINNPALNAIKHDMAGRVARLFAGTLRLGDNIEFVLQKQSGEV
jgi:hypothetical protein